MFSKIFGGQKTRGEKGKQGWVCIKDLLSFLEKTIFMLGITDRGWAMDDLLGIANHKTGKRKMEAYS